MNLHKIAIFLLLPFLFCLTACGLKKAPTYQDASQESSEEFFKEEVNSEDEMAWP
ncbi:MAG: hypothetical protein K2P93_06105 [Alphaproteobacteria bacterium]|nr:hypothetical protein [Alphaproteobacteria bacterium]